MKRLLLFLFVSCAVFAGAWNDAYWNYHNPYIYHYLNVEVWKTETMNPTLNSLELYEINLSEITNSDVKAKLQEAISNSEKAEVSKKACEDLYASTISALPSEVIMTGIINPIYLSMKIQLLMATGMIRVDTECAAYGKYWRATMDSAQSALLIAKKELSEKAGSSVEKFEDIRNSGICDDDFSGESKNLCKNAEFDYGALTGKYLPDLNNYWDYFTAEGQKYAPNITGYSGQITNIYKIAMPSANRLSENSEEAEQKAKEEYGFISLKTEQKMKEAKQKLNIMNDQKISMITDSIYSEDSKGTISDRYAKLKDESARSDSDYVTAVFSSSSKSNGHVKTSITLMTNAHISYDMIVNESDAILNDATKVVNAQKEEAMKEMGKFQQKMDAGKVSNSAKELYSLAKDSFAKGDDSLKMGEKFNHYLLAAADSRKAYARSEEKPAELETDVTAELKKTQEIISNAKKDGISVYSQEEEIKLLSGIVETWVLNDLEEIQKSILQQAQIKYGYLEVKRKEILQKIQLSGGKLDDLLVDMKKTEANAFDGDKLDVFSGLGNFASIAKEYTYIEGEIEKDIRTIVENGINTDFTVNIENSELDVPANITARLFVANPYGFGAKTIDIKQKTSLELSEQDILEGAEIVNSALYQSGTLKLQINEIKPYEQIGIGFNKQAIVAQITKKEKTIVGTPDGNAKAEEKIEFETIYEETSVYVPSEFKDWTIDGKTVSGIKTGKLSKGKHRIEGTYLIKDAFVSMKNDFKAIKTGLNSEVSYDYIIIPEVDINDAEIVLNEETGDRISGFSVLSYGGAEIKGKKSIGNNMYAVQLSGLKAWQNVTLRVAYTIEGSKEYAGEELALLKTRDWDEKTNSLINSAENSLKENDTRRAVEYIEQAKTQIEKEKLEQANEKEKLDYEKERVESQKEEIVSALKVAEENNGTGTQTYYQLEIRNGELHESLKSTKSSELAGFDASWTKKKSLEIRKRAFDSFNSLKQKYLTMNNGVANETAFSEFEAAFSRLEASGGIDDAMLVESKLKAVEEVVESKNKISKAELQEFISESESIILETTSLLGEYTKEYDSAKGSQVSALFGADYRTVQKEITALENLVKKGAGSGEISSKISNVKKLKKSISETLDYLKKESSRKIQSLKEVYANKKDKMSESDRNLASQGLVKMDEQYNKGNYVDSLIAGDAVTKIIQRETEWGIDGTLILGVTALVLIGAIIIYLLKGGQKRSGPRHSKKLRSIDDI